MKSNRFTATLAILCFVVLVAPPSLMADQAEVFGPSATRRQLFLTGTFTADTMFKQPLLAVSETWREPKQVIGGTAVIESISGQIMLPRGQHIVRAQIVNSIFDPVRSEVPATLDFSLVSVTDEYAFYTVSLRSPVRIPDANAFGVVVLRAWGTAARNGEVSMMLNILQPR
jgi:hypothetical protein